MKNCFRFAKLDELKISSRESGSSALGMPLRLCRRKRGPAVEEWKRTGAMRTQLSSARFVDLMGSRVEHHAIILLRPLHANEAACDILLHGRGVAGERIAPAATAMI